MKRTEVTATYRIGEHELVQMSVSIPANYPDAVAEAKATVIGGVREMLADVMAEWRQDTTPAE